MKTDQTYDCFTGESQANQNTWLLLTKLEKMDLKKSPVYLRLWPKQRPFMPLNNTNYQVMLRLPRKSHAAAVGKL